MVPVSFGSLTRHKPGVTRKDYTILVRDLSRVTAVKDFIVACIGAKEDGYDGLVIDFGKLRNEKVFPNIAVPITAFCDHLSETDGIGFELINAPKSISQKHLIEPVKVGNNDEIQSPFNKVWKFASPEDVFLIVTKFIDALYEFAVFDQKDVPTALEWCLNEVIDNVLQHSAVGSGYVMGQLQANSKQIVFCVADAGQGIYNSLRSSKDYDPKNPFDAITLALQEGVTRDKAAHQGNGLWGLNRIIEDNTGSLTISSSDSKISISGAGAFTKDMSPWLNSEKGGTVIDFQIDYSKPISLTDALKGHKPESIKLLHSITEDGKKAVYKLAAKKSGFGTRKSGERIRNEITNTMMQSGLPIIVDFDGVGVISSSFADEVIGKLFSTMGPVKFMSTVQLNNMNSTIQVIVNRAIEQRFIESKAKDYA